MINLSCRVLLHWRHQDLSDMKGSRQLWLALSDWSCVFERDAFNCQLFRPPSPVISASDKILDEFSPFVYLEYQPEEERIVPLMSLHPVLFLTVSSFLNPVEYTIWLSKVSNHCSAVITQRQDVTFAEQRPPGVEFPLNFTRLSWVIQKHSLQINVARINKFCLR